MSGTHNASTERLSSLLGHVTHRGFDDLVDPKYQRITYPTGNPDLLITGELTLCSIRICWPRWASHVSFGQCESYFRYNR
jgi:hypothetical protein